MNKRVPLGPLLHMKSQGRCIDDALDNDGSHLRPYDRNKIIRNMHLAEIINELADRFEQNVDRFPPYGLVIFRPNPASGNEPFAGSRPIAAPFDPDISSRADHEPVPPDFDRTLEQYGRMMGNTLKYLLTEMKEQKRLDAPGFTGPVTLLRQGLVTARDVMVGLCTFILDEYVSGTGIAPTREQFRQTAQDSLPYMMRMAALPRDSTHRLSSLMNGTDYYARERVIELDLGLQRLLLDKDVWRKVLIEADLESREVNTGCPAMYSTLPGKQNPIGRIYKAYLDIVATARPQGSHP